MKTLRTLETKHRKHNMDKVPNGTLWLLDYWMKTRQVDSESIHEAMTLCLTRNTWSTHEKLDKKVPTGTLWLLECWTRTELMKLTNTTREFWNSNTLMKYTGNNDEQGTQWNIITVRKLWRWLKHSRTMLKATRRLLETMNEMIKNQVLCGKFLLLDKSKKTDVDTISLKIWYNAGILSRSDDTVRRNFINIRYSMEILIGSRLETL